ncbi:MAG: hypothetical protein ABIR18_09425 [Chitinophagaceae bacterium]
MTDKQIKDVIRAIEEATEKASKSKESATKFLRDAGIPEKQPKMPNSIRQKRKIKTVFK